MFEVFEDDDWKIICPKVNIKGAIADKFRELIRDSLEEGTDRFKFDFKNLTDIDVTALSVFIVMNKINESKTVISEYKIINANFDIQNLFKAMKISLIKKFKKAQL